MWWPLPEWFREKYQVIQQPVSAAGSTVTTRALIVRNQTQVHRELLEQFPALEVIGRLGVGLDNIDLTACRDRGVAVVTARGANANAVAEYVMAAMFQRARFLIQCDQAVRAGVWDRQAATGSEIGGKTLGLIGVGDIGQRVALRAGAMGMRVVAFDPFLLPSSLAVQDLGVESVSMTELLQQSDFLSLHLPLTTETRHLIGARELQLMKPTATLINTARGHIIQETALVEHLVTHPHFFAVLDVRDQEPPSLAEDPLHRLANVLCTPHIAGITRESAQRVAESVLADVDRILTGQSALSRVV